jgi:hypothetical protein
MPQRLCDVELASLVPETKAWDNGQGIGLREWIYSVGSFEHMIAYGELFWPVFVEHDGCILRAAGFDEESYLGFLQQTGGNKRAVEMVINHVHITDLIYAFVAVPTPEQQVYLGRLIKEMWEAKLAREFPGREVIVSFNEKDEDNKDYQVTVYQPWC